jgi:hypothetical protein
VQQTTTLHSLGQPPLYTQPVLASHVAVHAPNALSRHSALHVWPCMRFAQTALKLLAFSCVTGTSEQFLTAGRHSKQRTFRRFWKFRMSGKHGIGTSYWHV